MNRQDSAFYMLIRSIYKWIVHLASGTTEIERAANRHDLAALEYSLNQSKVLAQFRERNCKWDIAYNEEVLDQLCALKGIDNKDAKFRVSVVFKELYSWKHALMKIEEIRKTKYDSGNKQHEEKLMQIWESLRHFRTITARKSVEWIELGFQADDPATDFRGTGLLGLLNLHKWVEGSQGKEAFRVADTKGTDYFFASASIYLTMLTYELVKDRHIDASFWVDKPDTQILPSFQRIFTEIFRKFNDFWEQAQDKSMMQFNMNLIGFSNKVKSTLIREINARIRDD